MMQQVVSGSEMGLRDRAAEALGNVKALWGCIYRNSLEPCQGNKGLITFRSGDLLTGLVELIDWDQDRGVFQIRHYEAVRKEPIADWSSGYIALTSMYGPRVGYTYIRGNWVEGGEREAEVIRRLERDGVEFEDKVGFRRMEFLQVGEYLPVAQQVSDHAIRIGSICLAV